MYSNNFGVIEVASARTTSAPGWAYVPDVGTKAANAPLQPSNRKRARNQGPNLSGADLTARQETKARKDLEALDRDGNRDVNIPIPPRKGAAKAPSKSTPNVRKILQSQKTFANHLDDYFALVAHDETNPAHPNQHTKRPPQPNQFTKKAPQPNQYTKRKSTAVSAEGEPGAGVAKSRTGTSRSRSRRDKVESDLELDLESHIKPREDTEMIDAPPSFPDSPSTMLVPYGNHLPPSHPGDNDPLLESVLPAAPIDHELRALITQPALTYTQAKSRWTAEDRQYPIRRFCELCGYWGRVRCMKCGTPVCALDCLEVHREECITRYGL